MIRLHCTKKLLAKLPLHEDGRLRNTRPHFYAANDAPESILNDWHANLVVLQRRQCVMFVHDATRFPVFVPALKKADFANLDYWFATGLLNTLLKTGADNELMQQAELALGVLVCDSNCNRSVQGTLNRMVSDVDYQLAYDAVSVAEITGYRTGAWLADGLCGVKGSKEYIQPSEEMFQLFGKHSPNSQCS